MNGAGVMAMLLAAGDVAYTIDDLRRGFQTPSRPMSTTTLVFILIGLCVLIAVVARLAESGRRRASVEGADYLSRAVELLGLDKGESQDLLRVARQSHLPHPTAMLLTPANLSHAAKIALKTRPDPQLRQRLDRLSIKLFGTGLAEDTASGVRPG